MTCRRLPFLLLVVIGLAVPAAAQNPVSISQVGTTPVTTTLPVSGTVTVIQGTGANLKVDLSGTGANATAIKVDGSAVTQPVSGTFWQATQPVSGTFFQASQPVTIVDGGDVTLGAKADARSTATDTTAITMMQVFKEISFMEQNPASRAVTNAGTFAVQAAQSGTWNIGTVTTLTGITNALPSGTNVIGHVIADTGSTTAVTGNVTVTQATGTNLHAVLDTTSTTAVTQATAGNLNMTEASAAGIKTDLDPLVVSSAGGYVRQDSTATIAKESGGNLATVVTNTAPNLVATAGSYVRQDSTGTMAKETYGNLNGVLVTLQAIQKQLANIPTRSTMVNALPVTTVNAPPSIDPCFMGKKGNVAISQTASTKLVSGQPGQVIYVCYARAIAGAAEIPSFWEGTGSACGTGTAAVSGSTTAANGESLAANGGFSAGMGIGSVAVTKTPGNDLCLGQSGSNRLSGNITYVYGAP